MNEDKEFDDELWLDMTLVEFLDIFTTAINKQENLKLKSRQTDASIIC